MNRLSEPITPSGKPEKWDHPIPLDVDGDGDLDLFGVEEHYHSGPDGKDVS